MMGGSRPGRSLKVRKRVGGIVRRKMERMKMRGDEEGDGGEEI
jgi:hypothetical protein